MADNTKIGWTHATWNIITGCTVLSPGCKHCYAMRLAGTRLRNHVSRAGLTAMSKAGPVWNGEVRFNEQWLDQPLRWKRPRMIFVCAHGDLFHENVPSEWIDRAFAMMAMCPQHVFQVLTKRSARMLAYFSRTNVARRIAEEIVLLSIDKGIECQGNEPVFDPFNGRPNPENLTLDKWPMPNVWLGVSVEDQTRADERIPDLLATPAAVRWISAEPLLGPINLRRINPSEGYASNVLAGHRLDFGVPFSDMPTRLDWIVVGCESGPGARPMHPDWARDLRDQCAESDTPYFLKQMIVNGMKVETPPLDGVVHDAFPRIAA